MKAPQEYLYAYVFVPGDTDTAIRRLQQVRTAFNDEVLARVPGSNYLWFRDYPALFRTVLEATPCLALQCRIGDSLDDEWAILDALRTLSIEQEDVYIRLVDEYGDVLLTSAGNQIPDWLHEKHSERRCYIHDGRMVVIPEDILPKSSPTYKQALELMSRPELKLLKDQEWDNAVFKDSSEYKNLQRTRLLLPRRLAALFLQFPIYINRAALGYVEASTNHEDLPDLYLSDSAFSSHDNVECVLNLTPRVFAYLYHAEETAADLAGLSKRLIQGAEILIKGASRQHTYITRANVLETDAFKSHVSELAGNGYFEGEVPGSKKYDTLLQEAAGDFLRCNDSLVAMSRLVDRLTHIPLPSNESVKSWPDMEDSTDWFTNMSLDDQQPQFENIIDKVVGWGNATTNDWEDPSSSGDSDEELDEEPGDKDPGSPVIDEDDFLEFFLKEALKLSPEQIDGYRAENVTEDGSVPDNGSVPDDESDSDDEDLMMEEELKSHGVIDKNGNTDYSMIKNLLESLKSEGGLQGPAAQLFSELGLLQPRKKS